MLEELLNLDRELFLYLNGLGTPIWDDFWIYLSRTLSFITIPIYMLAIFLSYRIFGTKNTLIILGATTLLLLTTEQLSVLFKQNIGRLRPCHDNIIKEIYRNVGNHCGGQYSYFSAHAANSSAFAVFFGNLLSKKFRGLFYFLLFWSLLVSYSRIYIGVHFPLDVITGLFFGILLGYLFSTLLKKKVP